MTYPPTSSTGHPAPGPVPGSAPAREPAPRGPVRTPAPGTDLGADLGAALTFALRGLQRNVVAYLVPGVVYLVLILGVCVVATVAMFAVIFSRLPYAEAEPELLDMMLGMAAFYGVLLLLLPVSLLWQSGSAHAAEVVREGGRPRIGQVFAGPVRIMLTVLLVAVITTVGVFLLYVPGLIASVVLIYAVPAAARGAGPVEAVKQSVALARANLATTIVAVLVISLIATVAAFVLPAVIALAPFLMLFELALFERLNGRELPDPARA